jgi:GMP synthase-like glutamine amidotransferase
MAVYERHAFASVDVECDLVRSAIARRRPVLGVCLGAQILAAALGAKVYKGDRPEVGFGSVTLTTEARRDALFTGPGDRVPVFHWHGDTFDLPVDAVRLASSDQYANQAFRVDGCAYGLQFHLELDRSLARAWRPHLPEGVGIHKPLRVAVERVGRVIINRFFRQAARA